MFTNKTRVISAIVTVCMLLSLMASFCLPAAAAENYDEIVPATGLTDVSALPDIKDGYNGIGAYKVTDRAGMDVIAKTVATNEKLSGCTFTMANDIDMTGVPFAGIGAPASNTVDDAANTSNYTFRGTFDGNGFVFTNLFMYIGSTYGAGLFGNCYGATIKNVGIASGLVVGADRTGAIVGLAHNNTKLINCWNAATVISGSSDAAGGLVGAVVDGKATLTNCYNLGLIYNHRNAAAGLVGKVYGTATNFVVNNSYSAGTLVDGFYNFSATSHEYFGAIMRPASATTATSANSADNYYLDTIGKPGWEQGTGVSSSVKDGATAFSAGDLPTIHQSLNNNISSDSATYTVAYDYSEAGYPVLTYMSGNAVLAKRLPAADAQNVMGNDWAVNNALFATISSGARRGVRLPTIEIASADDLFIFTLLSAFNKVSTYFGVALVEFVSDVDMKDLTLANTEYFVPIAANSEMSFSMDGNGHVLYNWACYTYHSAAQVNASGGFIHQIISGSLQNLSLENAYSAYDQVYASVGTPGNTYPSLTVEMVNTSATLIDCSATGHIDVVVKGARNANNDSGLVGRHWNDALTMRNCWSETTVRYIDSNTEYVARAIGSSPVTTAVNASKYSNVYMVAPAGKEVASTEAGNPMANDEIQLRITPAEFHCEEMAVSLNNISDNAFWTIKEVGGEKRIVRAADISETPVTLAIQRYVPTPIDRTGEPMPYGPADISYFMRNTEYYPTAMEGYELENGVEIPVVLRDDTTINYYMVEPDFTYVNEAETLLANHNPGLYGAETNAIFDKLQDAVDKVDDAAGEEAQLSAIYDVAYYYNEAKRAMASGDLNLEYPNLPTLSQYDTFASMGIADWGISTKEDWIYATEMEPADAATLRLHLLNNVDMQNTAVEPLAYTATFTGLIDGHGYSFYNFKMDMTDPNNFGAADDNNKAPVYDNSFGLVAHLGNGGVIQNLGLASGSMTIKGICSQDQGVGGFAGVAESNSLIANCWNGLTINATNKSSASRVAGIVGRGAGILYGCYNAGTVGGNTSYIHGLDAYASNGAGRFYNCFSLPSAPAADRSAAIGQGGSYQTAADAASKPATPYQNTYSIQNDVIYQYKKHPSTAIVDYGNAHTLTWDAYNSGYMAYTMNKDHYNYAGADRVYWTLNEEGNTVHGTAENAVCKLTLMLDGEILSEQYVNGNATVAVTHEDYSISDVVVERGSAAVSGEDMNILTMDGTDVVVSFSTSCKHEGTTTYTKNDDGTHDWNCSACGEGEEDILCSHNGNWADNQDGTHSESCICGRIFTENCRFRTVAAVEGEDHHIRSCTCGAEEEEACDYAYAMGENDQHRHYCTVCNNGTTDACTFGGWEVVKVPTLDEEGEERNYCVCGNYQTRAIDKLTGSPVTITAPVAHADETVEVSLHLNALPEAGISGFIVELKYDPEIFTFKSAASEKFGSISKSVDDERGELTLALAGDTNITDGNAVATLVFEVAKDAPAGGSVMTVVSASGEYVPENGIDATPVALTGSIGLINVASYAWGDANGDKKVTIADVVFLLRVVNGVQIVPDEAADVDGNVGFTTADAVLILRYLLGEYEPNA